MNNTKNVHGASAVTEVEVVELRAGMTRLDFKDNGCWHNLPAGRYTLTATYGVALPEPVEKLHRSRQRAQKARGLSGEAWSVVTKRCFDTGGNFACSEVSASRCTVCPNRKAADGVREDGNG